MSNLPEKTPVTGGGLHISSDKPLGLSNTEKTEATHRWNTMNKVVETIERWGFMDAQRPTMVCPEVTAEMLLTPDVNLYSTMFAATKDWYNYSNKLRARIVAELLQCKNEMDDIAADTRKRFRKENESRKKPDKLSPAAIDDEITTDMRYRELKLQAQELTQLKYELEARVEELETNMKVVSRNIEVRREEMSAGRKSENMPGRDRPWRGM